MTNSETPNDGDFAHWVEEKAEAIKFQLGEKFAVLPTELQTSSVHAETTGQKLEEVLMGHEAPTAALLEELNALDTAPQLSDEELTRQALDAGGDDGDPATPE